MKNEFEKNCNRLILSIKILMTLLLVLFTVGSYTFSGVNAVSNTSNILNNSNLTMLKYDNTNFPIKYLTPLKYLRYKKCEIVKKVTSSELIMDNGIIEADIFANLLSKSNKNIKYDYAHKLAVIYIEEAKQEGVNHDIAFAQMCLETGFLKFDGDVCKLQNNFCGLGVTGRGVKGLSFPNIRDGVRAHIQHLKAYGSKNKLNNKVVDNRFGYVKRGSALNISGLTGKWAMDVSYDKKIRSIMSRLYN